ncbi:MAG TPA: bifunctional DNA primase/polymerase, partial [Microbacterium sp.]|nr:bifunctional DNA primase/polymerase [Microbacterium sp.]
MIAAPPLLLVASREEDLMTSTSSGADPARTRDALISTLVGAPDTPLPFIALALASAGIPVFPCAPGGKAPAGRGRGFLEATTDLEQVGAWWRARPRANIGMPTGWRSGVVVVDVDVHGPADGYAGMRRARGAGLIDGWMLLVGTPSGGTHAYYPAVPGLRQSSWQAAKAGVDFRGDGGYVIVPPSTITAGGVTRPYVIRHPGHGESSPVDSVRLRDLLAPRPVSRPDSASVVAGRTDVSRLAAWVANRQEGARNSGVFWAACRMAENGMNPTDAFDVLAAAAARIGLDAREVATTVRSAYRTAQRAGSEQPRR